MTGRTDSLTGLVGCCELLCIEFIDHRFRELKLYSEYSTEPASATGAAKCEEIRSEPGCRLLDLGSFITRCGSCRPNATRIARPAPALRSREQAAWRGRAAG